MTAGSTYFYVVKPVFSDSSLGTSSNEVCATVAAASTLQLTATSGESGITLTWNTPANADNIIGFNPYRGTSAGGEDSQSIVSTPVTGSSYTDSNVTAGTTYYYVVVPQFRDSTMGTPSNEAYATVTAAPAPFELTATAGDTGIVLTWNTPANADKIISFNPYRGTTSGGEDSQPIASTPVTGSSYTDSNVTAGTTYYYVVAPQFRDSTMGTLSNEAYATAAISAAPHTTIVLTVGSSAYSVNGNIGQLDAFPEIQGSRTFLPIRPVIEALGGSLDWSAIDQKVTINMGSNNVQLWIGQDNAQVNGAGVAMELSPYIANSRTMLPLRFIAENLGCCVQWDGSTQTITIVH